VSIERVLLLVQITLSNNVTMTFRSLVVSLIHSRLDYGNFVLLGLPAYMVRQLQSVLNAAARLVFCLRRHDHITDALAVLHWLRLPTTGRLQGRGHGVPSVAWSVPAIR